MNLAHELRAAGAPERALKYAYGLVREAPDDPEVALGYVFLILGDRGNNVIPDALLVAKDAWVRVGNEAGETVNFTIDDGASFFAIDVRGPDLGSVKRIIGLKTDDTFDVEKGPLAKETWKVAEIKSKYLHLLHVIMEQFEHRFPDHNGMWRISIKDGNIASVLDVIRKSSEANRERAKLYTEGGLPLAFVAMMMGGDAPSFAQYVRSIGGKIATCTGRADEFIEAAALANEARAVGAVLDLYTAWVAAELGILDILKTWFGRLLTPQSTIDVIDQLIARERNSLGKRMMTVAWQDGQFVRQEATDEFVDEQISALQTLRDGILAHCEVVYAVLPNDLTELALKILELVGSRILDPIYVARAEGMILISDDFQYRQVARADADVRGVWLQASLASALAGGIAERGRVTKAYVQLASRRHAHIQLDATILREVYDTCTDLELREFDVITDFIGVEQADIQAHAMVTGQFLRGLWSNSKGDIKSRRATGLIMGKLLRHRARDWPVWLALIVCGSSDPVTAYLEEWLRGHFLPVQAVSTAYRQWQEHFKRLAGRQRLGAVSVNAMRVAGVV